MLLTMRPRCLLMGAFPPYEGEQVNADRVRTNPHNEKDYIQACIFLRQIILASICKLFLCITNVGYMHFENMYYEIEAQCLDGIVDALEEVGLGAARRRQSGSKCLKTVLYPLIRQSCAPYYYLG